MGSTINHLRPLLRLAESAQKAGDDELARTALTAAEVLARNNPPIDMTLILEYMWALANSCDKYYSMYNNEELAVLRKKVMQELARHNMSLIEQNDQKALSLPPMIQLITAMYLRKKDDKTEGVSVALVIDENGVVQFPRKGPLINELQEYCDNSNSPHGNIEHWLPVELAGYRLMHGSLEVQDILPEELVAMSF